MHFFFFFLFLLTSTLSNPLQVGDVVLVHDETVMENEFKMAGLETLVHLFVNKIKSLLLGMMVLGFLDRKMLLKFTWGLLE